jgi:hypothetical protein
LLRDHRSPASLLFLAIPLILDDDVIPALIDRKGTYFETLSL